MHRTRPLRVSAISKRSNCEYRDEDEEEEEVAIEEDEDAEDENAIKEDVNEEDEEDEEEEEDEDVKEEEDEDDDDTPLRQLLRRVKGEKCKNIIDEGVLKRAHPPLPFVYVGMAS